METVFSHIIQKRFSRANEDIATDALAFILNSSESARKGMMKLLRGINPNMPDLRFQAQQVEGTIRPDLWGYDANEPHVYIENKFWAGLTENQPISYLKQLAKYNRPTILLMVVPKDREQTIYREVIQRLLEADIATINLDFVEGNILCSFSTGIGPILAITSWSRLLSIIEQEVANDPSALSDLLQLRALCVSADSDAFKPISTDEITDQRAPAFILQLWSIVQASVEMATTEKILKIGTLKPQASSERIGRYAWLSNEEGVGIWFGIHFVLWKKHGGTPLWMVFSATSFGRAHDVRQILEPWATKHGIFTTFQNNNEDNKFAVAIDIRTGEEKDEVVRSIVDLLKKIADVLSPLNPSLVEII